MTSFSSRIKELRENINLSIPKMAAKLAVESYVVRDTELRKQRISQELILKYAEYFGVTLDWLMTGEGEKFAKADNAIREPAASYGAGILERIDSRDEKIAKQMDVMMAEIMKLSKEIQELKKGQVA